MKLRIQGNAVRLRLDRDEVAAILSGREVTEHSEFPSQTFRYALALSEHNDVRADFRHNTIEVSLPRAIAKHWAETDSEVSIRATVPVPGGDLAILVEKDFECLDPRPGESQDNRFANPNAQR